MWRTDQTPTGGSIAFGHGIHACLGAALARLEGRVALSQLLARCGDMQLAGDGPWEPRRALHVHGPARLPIRFTMPAFKPDA